MSPALSPKQPRGREWQRLPDVRPPDGSVVERWCSGPILVTSGIHNAELPDGSGEEGPQWLIGVSAQGKRPKPHHGGWTPTAGRHLTPPAPRPPPQPAPEPEPTVHAAPAPELAPEPPPAPPSAIELAELVDEPMVLEPTRVPAPPPRPAMPPPPLRRYAATDPNAIVHESLDRLIAESAARSRLANYRVLRTPVVPCDKPGCFICRNPRGG